MIRYYLSFQPTARDNLSVDPASLYEVSNLSFAADQSVDISTTGVAVGKLGFDPLSFTMGSSAMTSILDQHLATGTALQSVELYAYDVTGSTYVPVAHDTFKLATLQSDNVDLLGTHSFSLSYGGLRESTLSTTNGVTSETAVGGWNGVTNVEDDGTNPLSVKGGAVRAPPLPHHVIVPDPTAATSYALTDEAEDLYVRILDASGGPLGGADGWIRLDAAATQAFTSATTVAGTGGQASGKLGYAPLSLTFNPGSLEPSLLAAIGQHQSLKIEVAGYRTSGPATGHTLVDDYVFSQAQLTTFGTALNDGDRQTSYTLTYAAQQSTHYDVGVVGQKPTSTTASWSTATNAAAPVKTTAAATSEGLRLAATDTTEVTGTAYYLSFTIGSRTFLADGGALYAVNSGVSYGGSTSSSEGAGVGRLTFGPMTFQIPSGALSAQLDAMMAAGRTLTSVTLFGYSPGANPTVVSTETFRNVAVVSDVVTPGSIETASATVHSFTVNYGALDETVIPLTAAGIPDKAVTSGWDSATNAADKSAATVATAPDITSIAATPNANQTSFARFVDGSGKVIGGGWVELSQASFANDQAALASGSTLGSGRIGFEPLSLRFAAGTLEPALFGALAAGNTLKIELATYESMGASKEPVLVDDYAFNTAAVASTNHTLASGEDNRFVDYTFDYGDELIQHHAYAADGSPGAVSTYGWNRTANKAASAGSYQLAAPAQRSDLTFASNSGLQGGYLSFTSSSGAAFSGDDGTLYEIPSLSFGATQTLNIGAAGAGAGKVSLQPLTFTIGSSALTTYLDQLMASGTALRAVDLYAYTTAGATTAPGLHDTFRTALVTSDQVNAVMGQHTFTIQYLGLTETAYAGGTAGTPVTKGWNTVTNAADDGTGAIAINNVKTLAVNTTSAAAAATGSFPDPARSGVRQVPTGGDGLSLYARILDAAGKQLSGGNGWIRVDTADLSSLQTATLGTTTAASAGKIAFNPLDLTFAGSELDPQLLLAMASGKPLKIELAGYDTTLVDDYMFNTALLEGQGHSATDDGFKQHYRFAYADEFITHYGTTADNMPGDVTRSGWNVTTNRAANAADYKMAAPATEFALQNPTPACYVIGTSIRTARGEVAVERLAIGDRVVTASGTERPIRWIGRRSYGARFVGATPGLMPICFTAGSLGDAVPARDLWVSPKHAMFLDGVLIQAEHLVNGATIVKSQAAEDLHYFHIELDSHDVIVAEGALSESFVDDSSRGMFHNVHEFTTLYPEADPAEAVYCAPRVEDGFVLEAVRHRLSERAGLRHGRQSDPAAFRGTLDIVDADRIEGWAQAVDRPDVPVCLDILVDGIVVAQTLARHYRPDLEAAGLGSGAHCFRHAWDRPLAGGEHVVEVRRSSDGAGLWCSPHALAVARAA